jgi:hypothetical protein
MSFDRSFEGELIDWPSLNYLFLRPILESLEIDRIINNCRLFPFLPINFLRVNI